VINTAGQVQKQKMSKGGENEPIVKKVMSCGNLLTRGDILLPQSQKELSSCDLGGEVSLRNFWKQRT
jgi:hypothetical protein